MLLSLGTPSTPSGSAVKRTVSSPGSPRRAGDKRDRVADRRPGRNQSDGDGHDGTSWVNPAESHVSRLVSSSNPMTTSTAADARSIARRWLFTKRIGGRVLSTPQPNAINTTPNPHPNTHLTPN